MYSKATEKDENNEGLLHHRERYMWLTARTGTTEVPFPQRVLVQQRLGRMGLVKMFRLWSYSKISKKQSNWKHVGTRTCHVRSYGELRMTYQK
jgi:hypothetical protein